jgi:xylan 1,4-beta-xylosidase
VGHGQIVETPCGLTYHTFLCSRPLAGRFSPLGRETGIALCEWREDGWLYAIGGPVPSVQVAPPIPAEPSPPEVIQRRFDEDTLPDEFQWLRTPEPDRIFRLGDGALQLIGRESLGSWFEQALVARRQEHLAYRAETTVTFDPLTYQHFAGLTTYYNRHKLHALGVTLEGGQPCLSILSCAGDWPDGRLDYPIAPQPIDPGPVDLAVQVDHASQQFFWRQGGDWQPIGPALDASVISDEGGRGEHGSFTGAFVGMVAFDITGQGRTATFTQFTYAPNGAERIKEI